MIVQRLLQGLARGANDQGEQRMARMATADLFDLIGSPSAAGVQVTPMGSLASTSVVACVQLIARSLASVPLVLYRREGAAGRQPATDHPLYPLLHDLSNPLMTSFELRETMFSNCLLYGNAYAEIEWSAEGYPVALWPLASDRVGIEMTQDRTLVFAYWSDDFGMVRLPGWRVHHLRGLTTSGVVGISPIRAAMHAVGLTLATEQFGSRYFENGARPSLVLSHPAKLTPEAMRNLRQSFEIQWSGLSNAHRIAVVGEGVKPEPIGIPPNEAQFLETRGFQVREVCRLFGVAPGMVGEGDTATYASAEQDMLRFRELTLGPWAERHEKAMLRDLLTPGERVTHFAKYRLDKLQATDIGARYAAYNTGKQAGFLTTNEIREMEDRNPVEGGDELWVPLNMAPAGGDGAERADGEAPAQALPILGYHIEGGVVTRNEARASVGLPPVDEASDNALRALRAKLEIMISAKSAGIDTQKSADLVGLDINVSDSRGDAETPRAQEIEGEPGGQGLGPGELIDAWVADVQRRLAARIGNDVRQQGAKAARHGGAPALSEWGENMRTGWQQAGEEMLQPLAGLVQAPPRHAEVAAWVTTAYQQAARELVG